MAISNADLVFSVDRHFALRGWAPLGLFEAQCFTVPENAQQLYNRYEDFMPDTFSQYKRQLRDYLRVLVSFVGVQSTLATSGVKRLANSDVAVVGASITSIPSGGGDQSEFQVISKGVGGGGGRGDVVNVFRLGDWPVGAQPINGYTTWEGAMAAIASATYNIGTGVGGDGTFFLIIEKRTLGGAVSTNENAKLCIRGGSGMNQTPVTAITCDIENGFDLTLENLVVGTFSVTEPIDNIIIRNCEIPSFNVIGMRGTEGAMESSLLVVQSIIPSFVAHDFVSVSVVNSLLVSADFTSIGNAFLGNSSVITAPAGSVFTDCDEVQATTSLGPMVGTTSSKINSLISILRGVSITNSTQTVSFGLEMTANVYEIIPIQLSGTKADITINSKGASSFSITSNHNGVFDFYFLAPMTDRGFVF
jgi:hypothetical protein